MEITAVIDTGYNGYLSLPLATITALALSRRASRSVTLGDGSRRVLNFHEAKIDWGGQRLSIPILNVEGDPLLGTALLQGYKLDADFLIGGVVRITPV